MSTRRTPLEICLAPQPLNLSVSLIRAQKVSKRQRALRSSGPTTGGAERVSQEVLANSRGPQCGSSVLVVKEWLLIVTAIGADEPTLEYRVYEITNLLLV